MPYFSWLHDSYMGFLMMPWLQPTADRRLSGLCEGYVVSVAAYCVSAWSQLAVLLRQPGMAEVENAQCIQCATSELMIGSCAVHSQWFPLECIAVCSKVILAQLKLRTSEHLRHTSTNSSRHYQVCCILQL